MEPVKLQPRPKAEYRSACAADQIGRKERIAATMKRIQAELRAIEKRRK